MCSETRLGVRTFTPDDQLRFAGLTGDVNPMHLDPMYARRTQAGVPVVHGMNAVLWALDLLAEGGLPGRLSAIKVRFEKFMPVGRPVEARLAPGGIELAVDGARVAFLGLSYDGVMAVEPFRVPQEAPTPPAPADLDMPDLSASEGAVPIFSSLDAFSERYPAISTAVGARVVAHLAMLSTIVGMHCPGLHSIFSKLNVTLDGGGIGDHRLHYRVRKVQPMFRLLEVAVGGHIAGVLEAFVRRPPVAQASSQQLRDAVPGDPYAGRRVLVVGGSRGLGELVAKISAMGGAHVTLTYAVGASDAEAVAADIRRAGGVCEVLRLDVRSPPAERGDIDWRAFTHVYYFATSQIFKQRTAVYSDAEQRVCFDVHVSGLHSLCRALMHGRQDVVRVFYPSSMAVEEKAVDTLEYVMAKASGELLCAAMMRAWPLLQMVVVRLPRIETDQTATVLPAKSTPALEALLPIIGRMNA